MKRQTVKTDSDRLIEVRQEIAKPLVTDSNQFVIDLFNAWKKLHNRRKKEHLSHEVIGALFYESLYELFDPKHRNEFLKLIEKGKSTK